MAAGDIWSQTCLALAVATVGLLALMYLWAGIRVIAEWERAPVLRLGKYRGLRGPGITWLYPGIDKIPSTVDLRIQSDAIPPQDTMTKDSVPVKVDLIVYYKVDDARQAVLGVANYRTATLYAAQTILRDVIGRTMLDQVLGEREQVDNEIRQSLDAMTKAFGVQVTSVEIRDVTIPANLQNAMSRQAAAERERRARIILAEAEAQAAGKILEAARQYATEPLGLQLRWMNILYEVAQENDLVIMIPANMPVVGAAGILGAVQNAQERREDVARGRLPG